MNNLTNQFVEQQIQQFAGAMGDAFAEECNQFMIAFLDLPKTYVDGDGVEQKTGFNQSYGWAMDRGYLLQTHATMQKDGLVQEMSMYQKKVSKFFKIKSTYSVGTEPCEAPEVKQAAPQSEAVPYSSDVQAPDGTPDVTSNTVGMNAVGPTTPIE